MATKKGLSTRSLLKKYHLNQLQLVAVDAIRNNKIVVLRGVAGTAKTFTAVYTAMKLLLEDNGIDRIAVTRPSVTTEKIGFLPGKLEDKMDPFLIPIISFFNKFGDAGEKTFDSLVIAGKIRRAPLAFMRGTTVENELLIVDEAQNITPQQMLMILTRLGNHSKIVVTGDENQNDIYAPATGMDYIIELSKSLPYIREITLTEIMRDPVITEIIQNWPYELRV